MNPSDFLPILTGVAIIVGVFLCIKRIASCLIKTVIMLVIAALLTFVYFNYIRHYDNREQKPAIVRQIDRHLHTAR